MTPVVRQALHAQGGLRLEVALRVPRSTAVSPEAPQAPSIGTSIFPWIALNAAKHGFLIGSWDVAQACTHDLPFLGLVDCLFPPGLPPPELGPERASCFWGGELHGLSCC